MLEVICINDRGTKKLIKGQKYIVEALWEESGWINVKPFIPHNGKLVLRRQVRIKGINDYFSYRFKTVSGISFYDISLFGEKNRWRNNIIQPGENYTGQYVTCRYDGNSKYLRIGEIYYVEEHKILIFKNSYGRNSENHTFKLTGLKNYVNTWNFDKIPLKEQRKLKLQNISGEKITIGLNKRKFLYFSDIEQKKILIQLFLDSIKNLEHIEELKGVNIIDTMLNSGKQYDIRKEDIKPLISKSLSKIAKDLGFL